MHTRARPRLRTSIAAISVALWALCAPRARAQSAEAEALFDQAESLEKAGKLAEACDAFESSNRVEARAGTLIRLGDCRERIHQIASAWSAYKDALSRVKDETKRAIATDKIAALAPRLSFLTVHVPPAAQLAGLELTRNGHAMDPIEWNQPVPLDGGTYTIDAHAPGRLAWQGTASVPDENGKIAIDVPPLAEDMHSQTTSPPAMTSAAPAPPPREVSAWTTKRETAVVAAGVAVLAGVGGVVLGELANGKKSDADGLCPQQVCRSAADLATASNDLASARSRALDANIAFGVAGAAVIAAGVLWLTGAPEQPGLAIATSPTGAVVTFGGRF
ncbi:MAG TPA: hypothetical protein VGG74_25415 [Kofleriaceae bacterium]